MDFGKGGKMSKVFVFNYDRCNGCRNCQIVCKDEYCEQPWLPYSEAQPLTGQFWMNIQEKVRGQVPWVRIAYTATFCNHCEKAPCLNVGQGAYRRDDGLVLLDPEKSKGNKAIVDACPIGAIYYNDELDMPQKCTGCAHLLDNGWDVPRCVDACSTDALLYIDESEVDLSQAEFLDGMEHLGAKVYLYNKPKRFVAGTIFDSSKGEVVIGTKIDLKDVSGTSVAMLETDDMGDFKFNQVAPGAYTIVINGGKSITADLTEIDLSVGDIDIA
jgi:Fe-S-cluster-containing dehydrogenase component